MKRTGFTPKGPPMRQAKQVDFVPRPTRRDLRMSDPRARMSVSVPKADVMRSEPYRRLVASLPCIACCAAGYSMAAHGNTGKGMGRKSCDTTCMPLCGPRANDCHAAFDEGRMFTKSQRREIEPLWANQTRMRLRALAETDAKVRKIIEGTIGL